MLLLAWPQRGRRAERLEGPRLPSSRGRRTRLGRTVTARPRSVGHTRGFLKVKVGDLFAVEEEQVCVMRYQGDDHGFVFCMASVCVCRSENLAHLLGGGKELVLRAKKRGLCC